MTFSCCISTNQHNCACSFALNLVTMGIKHCLHSLPASAAFLCSLMLLEVTRYLDLLHNENIRMGFSAIHPKLKQHWISWIPWRWGAYENTLACVQSISNKLFIIFVGLFSCSCMYDKFKNFPPDSFLRFSDGRMPTRSPTAQGLAGSLGTCQKFTPCVLIFRCNQVL